MSNLQTYDSKTVQAKREVLTKKMHFKPGGDICWCDNNNCQETHENGKAEKCTHIDQAVDTQELRRIFKYYTVDKEKCILCAKMPNGGADTYVSKDDLSLWMCLKCGTHLCRNNMHALEHFQTTQSDSHALCLNSSTHTIWCYACGDFIADNELTSDLQQCIDLVKFEMAKQHGETANNIPTGNSDSASTVSAGNEHSNASRGGTDTSIPTKNGDGATAGKAENELAKPDLSKQKVDFSSSTDKMRIALQVYRAKFKKEMEELTAEALEMRSLMRSNTVSAGNEHSNASRGGTDTSIPTKNGDGDTSVKVENGLTKPDLSKQKVDVSSSIDKKLIELQVYCAEIEKERDQLRERLFEIEVLRAEALMEMRSLMRSNTVSARNEHSNASRGGTDTSIPTKNGDGATALKAENELTSPDPNTKPDLLKQNVELEMHCAKIKLQKRLFEIEMLKAEALMFDEIEHKREMMRLEAEAKRRALL